MGKTLEETGKILKEIGKTLEVALIHRLVATILEEMTRIHR